MATSRIAGALGSPEVPSSYAGKTLGSGGAGDPDAPPGVVADTPRTLGDGDRSDSDFVSRSVLKQAAADGPPSRIQAVIAALAEKRLHADMNHVNEQLHAIAENDSWTDAEHHLFRAAPELIDCLAGLLDGQATMTIMSLFRLTKKRPRNAHGEVQADGSAIGRAVDIMVYMGFKIHLKTPDNADEAISGVAEVIGHLPPGKYTLGLPRPGGGALVDPEHDVFLKVTSLDQTGSSPSKGHFNKDLELLLEPARTKLREAFKGNPHARVLFMYPDGVDHLHITTLP